MSLKEVEAYYSARGDTESLREVDEYYSRPNWFNEFGEPVYDLEPIDTRFKSGETRTVEAGRRGGINSGEKRHRKAIANKQTEKLAADFLYCNYLADATIDELRDFIRWRGQQKRKATLAKKALKNLEDSPEG